MNTDLYSGGSDIYFVLCFDVFFPLPIVQSKHLRVQTTYVMLHPFSAHAQLFYLDRPRNTHSLYLQNHSKRRHAAMAYVCSSITAPHTEKREYEELSNFYANLTLLQPKKVHLGNCSTFTSRIKL